MNEISKTMRNMKLYAMADEFEQIIESVEYADMTPTEVVKRLIEVQEDDIINRQIINRLKSAKLEYGNASFNEIDYSPQRKINQQLMKQLEKCDYLTDPHDIIILGATGTGKSYIASALGRKACEKGYRVLYITMDELLYMIEDAELEHKKRKVMRKLQNYDLLIIDEFLSEGLTETELSRLAHVLDKRSYQKSTIYVTQKPVSKWHIALGGEYFADRIIDRIKHNSYSVILKGESQRKLRSTIDRTE